MRKREIRKIYGQIQKTQNAIRKDQQRKVKRYKKIAPKHIREDQMLDVSQWDDIQVGETQKIEGHQSEATKSTPELEKRPWKIGEHKPSIFNRAAEGGMKIGQMKTGSNGITFEYIGGPLKDPSSYREVGK